MVKALSVFNSPGCEAGRYRSGLLILVLQFGFNSPGCEAGRYSCFYQTHPHLCNPRPVVRPGATSGKAVNLLPGEVQSSPGCEAGRYKNAGERSRTEFKLILARL